jgi:flagellar FliL protein
MAERAETTTPVPGKSMKIPIVLGLVLALAGGGAGFFATFGGLILPGGDAKNAMVPASLPDIAFVPVEPMLINLGSGSASRHLRFTSQIEVARAYHADVQLLLPRIQDVLNSYLRAVELDELANPTSLVRLRAQMLRRIQIVTGEGRVRDLLITEFVLN